VIELGITRRYVRALFELELEEGGAAGLAGAKRVLSDLQWFHSLLQEEGLHRFLSDPRESPKSKQEALAKVLPDELQARSRDFLLWVAGRGRAEFLPHVAAEFENLLLVHEGVQRAEVTTVTRMEPEAHAQLQSKLEAQTGKKVQLIANIDPEILGGLRVKFGSALYDGSLRRELEDVRRDMMRVRMPEPAPVELNEAELDDA